jgi:hypothetical protein
MSRMFTILLALFLRLAKLFLSLKVSSLHMFFPGFIPFVSWGWLQVQSSSILGFFEFHFVCPRLFHKIPQAIQDKVKQAFHLPLDHIVRDPTNELKCFIFLLSSCWCLCYIWGGHSSQREVSTHLKRFMMGDYSFFQEDFSRASCVPCSHHSWEDSSTTCFINV